MVLLRSAIQDLLRGRAFYDKQKAGLGDYFEESLASDIESLRIHAGAHVRMDGYYRMLSSRFPYALYYQMEENQIRIYAILDCRRNPRWIRQRIINAKSGGNR